MTIHVASPRRVARSWLLEKLLGPAKKPERGKGVAPAPRGRAMSKQERGRVLDKAYETIKADLIRTMKSEASSVNAAERRIAKRHGIDPMFLNWYVINGSSWPSMPARTKKALRALQSVRMWFADVPSSWSRMKVPSVEEAGSRDKAIKELGVWFDKNFVTRVERKFTNMIWKKSRELLDVFKGRGKGSASRAALLLMRDFENRLGADGFQQKPAVRRVVELFD